MPSTRSIRVVGDQLAHHSVDIDDARKFLRNEFGERLVADRLHMLGQHIGGGQEFRGGAVPLQTGLDELGKLIGRERVEFAACAFVVELAVPARYRCAGEPFERVLVEF
ncbi:MAG: hypothetical protein ACXVIQ_13000 [Ilumatobacteraceae bacterium]